jgi:1-acyl-sn-glycerol-3-phosphate acyltransferase
MLAFLPAPVTGAIMFVVLVAHTLLWAAVVYVAIFLKVLAPRGGLRDAASRLTAWLAQQWAVLNTVYVGALLKIEWRINIDAELSPKGQYLVCANHQSWNDIFVLMQTFGRRAPFFKFFIKQELIWVPVLGLCWWGLDYPFMKRYTPEQVARDPSLKGKDLATTRKACERYRSQPVLILNFLEGTRFTAAKQARQQSPYRHLLKPKSGGFAFTLAAMGQRLNSLLDVTIVYPDGARGFWAFLAGGMRRVIVEVRQLRIPDEFFAGDYENDPAFRQRFQDWVARLWGDKDLRIGELKKGTQPFSELA